MKKKIIYLYNIFKFTAIVLLKKFVFKYKKKQNKVSKTLIDLIFFNEGLQKNTSHS